MQADPNQRYIRTHQTNNFNRDHIHVMALDPVGPGNANHQYRISVFPRNQNSDGPSDISEHEHVDYDLKFQKGPVKESGANGISEEALLAILVDRLKGFQSGPYSCRENALVLTKLEEAQHWLTHRTKARELRGVEGTSQV